MLLDMAIEKYRQALVGNVAATTERWYEQRLRPLSEIDKPIKKVGPDDLRPVWTKLATRTERWTTGGTRPPAPGGLSPFTLDTYYRAWRTFFKWCIEQEYIQTNPVKKLKRPQLPDQLPKAVSEDDLRRLLDATETFRDYALVCVLAMSSCRLGGLISLNLDTLDLTTGRGWVTEKGKGGGKTRSVYLHGETLFALRAYVRKERPLSEHRQVFLTEDGERPLTGWGVGMLLMRLSKKAEIVGRTNAHSFRHRFARNLLENGADLGTVSRLMGHSNIHVTDKFYARWDDKELKAKHKKHTTLPAKRRKAFG